MVKESKKWKTVEKITNNWYEVIPKEIFDSGYVFEFFMVLNKKSHAETFAKDYKKKYGASYRIRYYKEFKLWAVFTRD